MKKIVLFILFIGCAWLAAAQNYPYEWLSLGMSEDPSAIQRVRWRTDLDIPQAVAQITFATPSPEVDREVYNVAVESVEYDDYGVRKVYHHASFEGLEPGTGYLYRVGDGAKRWSEWFQFRTAQSGRGAFSFLYFGDVQDGIDTHYPRVVRQSILTAPGASFLLFAGDLTNNSTQDELNRYFNANGWIFGMKPVAAVPDNHEYIRNEQGVREKLTTAWGHLFSYPAEGTPDNLLEQGNYYFDYQDCRFVMINTKELSKGEPAYVAELVGWVERLLRDNPRQWCVVTHHQPMYSVSQGRTSKFLPRLLKPLYDKYDVDLVLSGHDHVYSRTRSDAEIGELPVGPINMRGPVYITSVAGRGAYLPAYHLCHDRIGSNTQLFQHIGIDEKVLNFKAYDATGELYDAFELRRDGVKTFTDRSPAAAQRIERPEHRKAKHTAREWELSEEKQQKYESLKNTKLK